MFHRKIKGLPQSTLFRAHNSDARKSKIVLDFSEINCFVRRFNPSAAGINPINRKAGLLTYPLPTPSRPPGRSVAKIVGNIRLHSLCGTRDLQQRGLFGISTRFPFNRRHATHPPNLCETKVDKLCQTRKFFLADFLARSRPAAPRLPCSVGRQRLARRCVERECDKYEYGECHERRTAVADKRQRNTHHRHYADGHTDVH